MLSTELSSEIKIFAPLVSVIMPAYNTGLFIREAIESILKQTHQNFELLVFDDCSTDNTVNIIESFNDKRIQLFKKPVNTGYTVSLIKGLEIARGDFIARMDSDDISHHKRFEKQLNFLSANDSYGIVGSFVETIQENKNKQEWMFPIEDEDIRNYTIVNSPFAHPAVMIRKSVLQHNHLAYSAGYEPCEDYKLWTELLKFSKGKNLPEVLLYYRLHQKQTIVTRNSKLIDISNTIRQQVLYDFFKLNTDSGEIKIHYYFFNEIRQNTASDIQEKFFWKKKLIAVIKKHSNNIKLYELVVTHWVSNLRTITSYQFSFILFLFDRSVLYKMSFGEIGRFFIKSIIRHKVKKYN